LGRHFPSAGGVAHFVDMAFGPRLASVTGWLFLSVIPVGLPAALHIATGFGQALFGWHDAQLLLAELGTLAIVWCVGSRGASSSANLQTLVAVLIVALIVAVWWRGGISPAQIPFPAPAAIDRGQLFSALSVMFWCFVGLEAFAHLASEFKHPERDFPRALMIGLLLAGSVYWACTVLVLHFHAFGEEMAAAASLPNIVVRLFGVEALWVACVIGYLACFASLNIYIQSFARLVWSQAQHKPQSYLARLSPRQIPRNALNAVLGSCVVSTLCIYFLDINLDALIVYANGIFIMIYLLCMLAGCRLLRGRYRLLAAVGSILCLLLLAMVGWKSLYALVMLAALWLFLPRRKLATGSV
ncbi:TPA: L-methionine/branched-chain amino acid transporter, partial [Klebsiella quasipneumoniae subsp. similipneumoniae]|nr:L-methionine/branched-chain amino acid transporter [Klebsiella quasipneumoniae subsp. similipneumoniae]